VKEAPVPCEPFTLRPGFGFGGRFARVVQTAGREPPVVLPAPPPAGAEADLHWMQDAFDESLRGVGITNPNPAVGCVIVKDGRAVGRGFTQRYGGSHAERMALASVVDPRDLVGATAYVTLEPCAHHGRQPPCVDALVEAPIRRVVVARTDPDPRVRGRGIARLREAGKTVDLGLLGGEVTAWNFPFFASQVLRRPVLVLKWAQTLDGQLADDAGSSQWISGAAARSYTHWLRQRHDAILVGAGTFLADLPRLSVRDCAAPIQAQPARLVVDPKGRLLQAPAASRRAIEQAMAESPAPICVVTTQEALAQAGDDWRHRLMDRLGCRWLAVPVGDLHGVGAGALVAALATPELREWLGRPLQSVLVEGGPALLAALIESGTADLLHVFVAPAMTGGRAHRLAMGRLLADAARYRTVSCARLGDDVLMEMLPESLFSRLSHDLGAAFGMGSVS
jgi:diaminohydroxyphosphoribosylaminopyrimidine deaminase/5-amino-6-(5-phosphoribosylamino)uracil reductase